MHLALDRQAKIKECSCQEGVQPRQGCEPSNAGHEPSPQGQKRGRKAVIDSDSDDEDKDHRRTHRTKAAVKKQIGLRGLALLACVTPYILALVWNELGRCRCRTAGTERVRSGRPGGRE